jgi:hypothetical protein
MYDSIIIHRNRTNKVLVSVGIDVSQDTITSQIRTEKSSTSTLIATWVVSYVTNGSDGELVLTLDNSALTSVEESYGYMDLKRVSAGEPLSIFKYPVKVLFQGVVTA